MRMACVVNADRAQASATESRMPNATAPVARIEREHELARGPQPVRNINISTLSG